METLIIEKNVPVPPFTRKGSKPEGSCLNCSRTPRTGLKTCDFHLAKIALFTKNRKEQGLCTWGACYGEVKKPHALCAAHRRELVIRNTAMRNLRKKKDLCILCGKEPQWWTLHCLLCRFRNGHDYEFTLPDGARTALREYRRKEKIEARRAQATLAVEWTADERTRKIFTMRHGLSDGVDRTLEEIGAVFNVTRERIRQIENAQLKWLESEGFDVSGLRPPFEGLDRTPQVDRRHLTSNEQRKKANCHRLVNEALESGALIKGLCAVCQSVDVVGHHRDYDKPLEVEWLCRKHHMEAHRGFWLDGIEPQTEVIQEMLDTLTAHHVRPEEAEKETGIGRQTIKRMLIGKSVRPYNLRAVQRLRDKLNANHAVN